MNNMDDIEIDNLLDENLFKPITDGLGFHHSLKKEKDVSISLKQKSLDLKSDFERRAKNISATQISNTLEKTPNSMGELSAFYKPAETKKQMNLKLLDTDEQVGLNATLNTDLNFEADLMPRLVAWILDTVIIASLITIMCISSIFITEIPLSFLSDNIYNIDIAFYFVLFSSSFYLFYFSFFDKTGFSTPGKRTLGLRVQRLSGKDISFIQSLNRSLITFLSLISLGLFSFLKVQDKLTDTVVVSKK